MPFTHQWLLEGHIIYMHVWDHVSGEELVELNQAGATYLENAACDCVYLVMHDEDMVGIPGNSMKQHMDMMQFLRDPRLSQTVGVGKVNAVTRFLQTVMNHALGMNTKRVDTLEEAVDFLQHLNPELPPITINIPETA
jgi:hypothetical protein